MTRNEPIYHIVVESDFREQLEPDEYRPSALAGDGFVHCALESSVIPVANDYYADAPGPVLLLEIDPTKLESETRYEAPAPIAGGGTDHLSSATVFPHVYGPIDRDAIVRLGSLGRSESGYSWPDFNLADSFIVVGVVLLVLELLANEGENRAQAEDGEARP